MVRVFSYVFALALASSSIYQIEAVPVERRQLGGVGCNVARLKTVGGLAATTRAVKKLAASDDPAVASAAATAQTGLQDASSGIKTIAGALLTGKAAPAAARDQVEQGLFSAQDALANVTSTDNATTKTIGDAQAKLEKTISAGQDVLAKCGGGGGDAAASATDSGAAADSGADNTDTGAAAAGDATGSDNSSADATDTADNTGDAGADNSSDDTADASGDNNVDGSNTTDDTDGSAEDSGATGANTGSFLRNSRIFGKRQIGGVQCNVARLQTVARLAASTGAVNKVKSSASGDAAVTDAASQASTALASARGAIVKIGAALVTGQKAPAAERDKVEKGLTDAKTALDSVNSSDPAVTAAVTKAQSAIASTVQAGQAVVSKC